MSKHIELAKKLKALADRGVDGEKYNAEQKLKDLLKKHNLTLEDIEGESILEHFFTLNEQHHSLWFQIIKKVNYDIKCYGPIEKSKVKQYKLAGNYIIESTVSDYIEIEAKFNFYKDLYEKESKVFYDAFIQANGLGVNRKHSDEKELSKEELEAQLRILKMAEQIKKGDFRKRISA